MAIFFSALMYIMCYANVTKALGLKLKYGRMFDQLWRSFYMRAIKNLGKMFVHICPIKNDI